MISYRGLRSVYNNVRPQVDGTSSEEAKPGVPTARFACVSSVGMRILFPDVPSAQVGRGGVSAFVKACSARRLDASQGDPNPDPSRTMLRLRLSGLRVEGFPNALLKPALIDETP